MITRIRQLIQKGKEIKTKMLAGKVYYKGRTVIQILYSNGMIATVYDGSGLKGKIEGNRIYRNLKERIERKKKEEEV